MTGVTLALVLLVFGIVVFATAVTAGVRAWAIQKQALVAPSERCAHTVPTPHGGGIAIAATAIMLGIMFSMLDWVPDTSMFAFVGLGFAMLAVGVWDDFGDVSAKLRLALHFLIVAIGLWSVPRLPTFSIVGYSVDSSSIYLLWLILLVSWVWLINLYNFMDGIDGLAAVQALALFAGMALNFWYMGFNEWSWMCIFMLAAVLGFTILNWPPAKIFMGDGGSGFLGFLIGFLMLLSASQTNVSLWSWLILLTLFISDATVTLITRVATGQNPLQAHNLHAYQKLARRFGRHLPVTLLYGGVMMLVMLPASLIANAVPHSGPLVFFTTFSAVSLWMYSLGAGKKEVLGG